MKLTITARQLRDLVTPVLPLVAKADQPVLTCVQFRATGTTLVALATDRYRAGMCRTDLTEATDFEALIRATDIKRVLALFKPTRFDDPTLVITRDHERIRVESADAFDGLSSASLSFDAESGEYPKAIPGLIRSALEQSEDGPRHTALNAKFLADFQHAVRDGSAIRLYLGTTSAKPTGIAIGDHFIGVIMPKRIVEGASDNPLKGWRELLGNAPKAVAS